jgi:hypothetical protein
MLQRSEAKRGLKVAPRVQGRLDQSNRKVAKCLAFAARLRALRFFQENGKRRWVSLGERSMTISMR